MGLDMYLDKHTYIPQEDRKKENINVEGVKSERVNTVVESIGQWRKANAIHEWFVENVQSDEDDNSPHYVDTDQLQDLLDRVNKVLKESRLVEGEIQNGTRYDKRTGKPVPIMEKGKFIENPATAKELLPTAEGFFFGSQDYNQFYYDDLVDTKKILEQAIKEGGDYYYQASW